MYDIIAIVKQAIAGLGVAFGGTWTAIAALASALKVDVASGKQVIIAAAAAIIGFLAGGIGNWIKQFGEKVAGSR
jgi:hypothetical protein